MEKPKEDLYYKGYIAGYLDGLFGAANGKTATIEENGLTELPIEAMQISQRAYHCLLRANCVYVADVAALSADAIGTLRGLGAKTAREIAHWLDACGIRYTHWAAYL